MVKLKPVDVAISPAEKFREFLVTRGQRLTTERRFIVDEIFAQHAHFDVDQLVARLSQRDDGRRVSRSTIYRTVASLEEAGLLRKIARPDGRDLYELRYGYPQHDHLICRETGKLIEFHSPELDEILQRVAAQHGFRMEGHRLEVYGLSREAYQPKTRVDGRLDRI